MNRLHEPRDSTLSIRWPLSLEKEVRAIAEAYGVSVSDLIIAEMLDKVDRERRIYEQLSAAFGRFVGPAAQDTETQQSNEDKTK